MLFVSQEGNIINTDPQSEYLNRVKGFIVQWQNGASRVEVKTSGSTGAPKTIHLSRSQIQASVSQTAEAFKLDENSLFLCNLHLDHIAGKLMILRALELKAELMVIQPDGDLIGRIGNAIYMLEKKRGHVFLAFVPMQLAKLMAHESGLYFLGLAQATILGGAKANQTLAKQIQDIPTPVFSTFGMTETVTHFALKQLNGEKPTDVFTALPGTEIRVESCGQLAVKNAATNHEWLVTNDLVKRIDDKRFVPIGRADNIINSGGIKLNLDEIELKIDGILKLKRPFFCYGLQDRKLGSKVVLFIESVEEENQFIGLLKKKMPKYEVPKALFFIPKFERTLTGKIDKHKTVDAFTVSDQ